jgi:DNA-directed RNA polymerase subunit N (RpoN/RPB10)
MDLADVQAEGVENNNLPASPGDFGRPPQPRVYSARPPPPTRTLSEILGREFLGSDPLRPSRPPKPLYRQKDLFGRDPSGPLYRQKDLLGRDPSKPLYRQYDLFGGDPHSMTLLRVRCVCGKVTGSLQIAIERRLEQANLRQRELRGQGLRAADIRRYLVDERLTNELIMDDLGLNRTCCRTTVTAPIVIPAAGRVNPYIVGTAWQAEPMREETPPPPPPVNRGPPLLGTLQAARPANWLPPPVRRPGREMPYPSSPIGYQQTTPIGYQPPPHSTPQQPAYQLPPGLGISAAPGASVGLVNPSSTSFVATAPPPTDEQYETYLQGLTQRMASLSIPRPMEESSPASGAPLQRAGTPALQYTSNGRLASDLLLLELDPSYAKEPYYDEHDAAVAAEQAGLRYQRVNAGQAINSEGQFVPLYVTRIPGQYRAI